jgi:SAM-dependent methyltransferase
LALLPPKPDERTAFEQYLDWATEHYWLHNYHLYVEDKTRAVELARQIESTMQAGNREEALKLLEQLRWLRMADSTEMARDKRWDFKMAQMPEDMGGPNKSRIRDFLSRRNHGRVLEAMCGFRTYYKPSPTREVVGMDFSREALERYPSDRVRIQFDLNEMDDSGLDFLGCESFDVVSICFGYNYLQNPALVFRRVSEILKPGGRITLVENPRQGYWDLAFQKSGFYPEQCVRFFRESGAFKKPKIRRLDSVAMDWEKQNGGHYYFVSALKA